MQTFQSVYKEKQWLQSLPESSSAALVLVFGDRDAIASDTMQSSISSAFPNAEYVGCSTSGEIQGSELHDNSLTLTAISFDSSYVKVNSGNIKAHADSYQFGTKLAAELEQVQLKLVLVFSDGQLINGSELIDGISSSLSPSVLVTGGLAGDQDRFSETTVWHNEKVESGLVVLVAFYGERLRMGHGHMGGWKSFGPIREITQSDKNVLKKIDNKPALDLYKTMLGDYAAELPSSALLFPLSIQLPGQEQTVVRTILNINEDDKSMVFAGNVPMGAKCQLMRANYEDLVDGAEQASENAMQMLGTQKPSLALLISCVGRRLVLNQRVEEELEIVADILPKDCARTGFYSYGELSPVLPFGRCNLHNQTMTITLMTEE